MKNKDILIAALFIIIISLVAFISFSPKTVEPMINSEKENELQSKISDLEEKVKLLENITETCTREPCVPIGECGGKDLNDNTVCKKLSLGSMLRVNADRASDIVFQCITDTQTTYLFYSRTVNDTIQILDVSYNNILNITNCQV